ncbi:MAG: dienelactone hydrolase family protein [Planctomycetota bacterium]
MMLTALLATSMSLTAPLPQDTTQKGAQPMSWTGVLDEASFAALHDLKDGAAPPLLGVDIEVAGARAYLSRPKGGASLGGVVVIHEWWGLNDHVKHWTDRLAADGYDALAIDLYGGTVATTREEALAAMQGVDEAAALATLRAAHAYLVEDEAIQAERTASIGWCFGGGWSLRLAIAEPALDAAVIYYGRLVSDEGVLASIEAPVLGVFGNRDSGIPPESVAGFAAAMKSAGKSLELRQYDANHAFANPSGRAYDAENAALAWHATRAFLAQHLSPEQPAGLFTRGTRELEVTAPKGWSRGGERNMRLATFTFGQGAECVVSAFPGDVGGLEANVNRWRSQLGAAPLSEDDIAALPVTPMFGRLATVVRVAGVLKGADGVERPSILLGAIAALEGETVFVKLTGPEPEVEAATDSFQALCRSLR